MPKPAVIRAAASFLVGPVVASALLSGDALAQRVVWTRDGDLPDDYYGAWLTVLDDLDGDSLVDLHVSCRGVACPKLGDGRVDVRSTSDGSVLLQQCGDLEEAGYAVTTVRDLDGDGKPELVIGGPGYTVPGSRWDGRVTLWSSSTGSMLWESVGERSDDLFGQVLGRLGDIDGDGFDEIFTASPDADFDRGRVYALSSKDGRRRTLNGTNFEWASLVGDCDGDGINDYAVNGHYGRWLSIHSGTDGTAILRWVADTGDRVGWGARSAGDFDGDGFDDVVCRDWDGVARFVRIYSTAKGAIIFEATAADSVIDDWGWSFDMVGDLDGDGIDDLAIGVTYDNREGYASGRIDLVSGRTARPLFHVYPDYKRGGLGWNVVGVGDVTGDGIPDFAAGASFTRTTDPKGGRVFLFAGYELFLEAVPHLPIAGDVVTVDLRGGVPGQLGLLLLTEIDGVPMSTPLLVDVFDGNGEIQAQADVTSAVSGLSFTVVGYGQKIAGRFPLEQSNEFVVTVQ